MCSQGFKQQAKTLNHEKKIHQGVDPFQCQVMKAGPFFFWLKMLQTCFQSFSNVDKLTVHGVREHGHEKPFQCSFCGQGFVRQQILDKHVKMHTGERPFRWVVKRMIAVFNQTLAGVTSVVRVSSKVKVSRDTSWDTRSTRAPLQRRKSNSLNWQKNLVSSVVENLLIPVP